MPLFQYRSSHALISSTELSVHAVLGSSSGGKNRRKHYIISCAFSLLHGQFGGSIAWPYLEIHCDRLLQCLQIFLSLEIRSVRLSGSHSFARLPCLFRALAHLRPVCLSVGEKIAGGGIVSTTARGASSVEIDAPSVSPAVKGSSRSSRLRIRLPNALTRCRLPTTLVWATSVHQPPSNIIGTWFSDPCPTLFLL